MRLETSTRRKEFAGFCAAPCLRNRFQGWCSLYELTVLYTCEQHQKEHGICFCLIIIWMFTCRFQPGELVFVLAPAAVVSAPVKSSIPWSDTSEIWPPVLVNCRHSGVGNTREEKTQAQKGHHCVAVVAAFSKMHPFGRPFVSHRLCIFTWSLAPVCPWNHQQVKVGVVFACS